MLDPTGHDCSPRLTDDELNVLLTLGDVGVRRSRARGAEQRKPLWAMLGRLVLQLLDDALSTLDHPAGARHRRSGKLHVVNFRSSHCATTERSYWGWTSKDWEQLLGPSVEKFLAVRTLPTEYDGPALPRRSGLPVRRLRPVPAPGHVQPATSRPARLRDRGHRNLARVGVRGARPVGLSGFPRGQAPAPRHPQSGIAGQQEPFAGGSPHGEFRPPSITPATGAYQLPVLFAVQRAVAALGHCDPPVRTGHNVAPIIEGVDPLWAEWIERWYATSTLTPKVRAMIRTIMAKAGRWLVVEHPEITQPSEWSRQTCVVWVAAVDRMAVGDYVQRRDALAGRGGTPISPRTKAHILMASRTFFRDCQEWEWFPRRFDPSCALAVPRSVAALIGTDPWVIADDVWAKLPWSGLNLEADNLPGNSAGTYYPLELIRVVTLTWLFSGLRSDEITRLRVGCVRWQHMGKPIRSDASDVLAEEAVCLLDIPVHKTGTAFTKPVDPLLGQAIEAWQSVRPSQPKTLDRKTAEQVDILFAVRAQAVARSYVNRTIIPALCAKAGTPSTDVRGKITSHRARSTIASQLYNAKEPMTWFELQAWLGHRSPSSTQHYAKISPATLVEGLHRGRLLRPQPTNHRSSPRPGRRGLGGRDYR